MDDRSYTDDELRTLVLDADRGFGSATLHTFRRLMSERDEARGVAKVLAEHSHLAVLPRDAELYRARQTANAYPVQVEEQR
jgi:hypothetical protein